MPVIKQHAAPFPQSIQNSGMNLRKTCKLSTGPSGNARTDGYAETDLQTSFMALAFDPEAQKKLKFVEDQMNMGI